MSELKSIIIFHRKNMDWYNKIFVPYMREQYKTRFTIITNRTLESCSKKAWYSSDDVIINIADIENKASNFSDYNEQDIYNSAREYEKKYNVTYMRDVFQQDRDVSLHMLGSYSKRPGANRKGRSLLELTNMENYYYNFFEKHISQYKVDLVIARPDDMIGFSITSIAKFNNIASTIQQTTRINGYMYWAYGPYTGDKQIKLKAEKIDFNSLNTEIKNSDINSEIASHAIKYIKIHLDRLSFKATLQEVIYTLKDRLNWLIKDIKRGKIGKRVPMIPKILSKINTYRDHRYYQKIFNSNIEEIVKGSYIYFPLPMEPEYATHSLSKNFNNVHAIVQQAALCMPAGYKLVVKEHSPNIGLKSRVFYTSLMKLPNVVMANYLIKGQDLIDKAESVMTLMGSTALEAGERGKMAILFGDSVEFMYLPHILLAHSMRDLPEVISKSIEIVSESEKQNIKEAFYIYKKAFKEIGYYAPDTPLFDGTSGIIKHDDFLVSINQLIDLCNIQRSNKNSHS